LSPARPAAWYDGRWTLRLLVAFLALYLAQNVVLSMFFKVTDFEWHLEQARQLFAQRPYDTSFVTYLPARFLLDALYLPLGAAARPLGYLLGLGALVWTVVLWDRLLRDRLALEPRVRAVALLWSLAILSEYLGRDLNDGGPGAILLLCLTLALGAQCDGRGRACGFWLALAFAWKATPLLFLPYLVLKRLWAPLGWFALFALLWLALPGLVVGWETLLGVYREWLEGLARIARSPDLAFLGFEPPRHQNQSLRALFARYLQGFGADHPIHAEDDLSRHPLFVQFLALPAPWPGRLYQAALLLLGLLFAWLFRRPWTATPAPRRLAEWSVVPILAALLSPLAWLHHFAVALPALWLVLAAMMRSRQGWPAQLAVGAIALAVFVLQRDILQRDLSVLELSYKLDAMAMLLLVALALRQSWRLPPGTTAAAPRSAAATAT